MCFSKEASYVTGTLLMAIGSYTFYTNKQKKLIPASCIPLFFGIQQIAEGNLWTSLEQGFPVRLESFANLTSTFSISAALFLFFAFIVWPLWIPLSALLPEKIPARRLLLGALLILGTSLSIISLLSLKSNIVVIKIVENSIQYLPENHLLLPLSIFIPLYGIAVTLPSFISTTRGFAIFGITSLASLIISYYLYYNTFTSVWCFVSACLSILIVAIIKAGNEEASAVKQTYK